MDNGQDKSQSSNEIGARPKRRRSHAGWLAVSIAAHAVVVAAIVYFAPPLSKPNSDWVLAYLVEVGDGVPGRSGSMRAGAAATPSIPIRSETGPLLIPARPSSRKPVRRSVRASRTPREDEAKAPDAKVANLAPAASASQASAKDQYGAQSDSHSSKVESSAGAGVGSGSGQESPDGSGDGAGTSLAHADYGNNPPPIYPATARRREQQGTVTLRVLVGNDGVVERAEIAESSGFDALDDAALETVRRRWRFVPARRGPTPVESWVLVPIRFALTEASAAR